MNKEIINKIEELTNDREFAARIANVSTTEEMRAELAEYGIHLNEEAVEALFANATATVGNGELNENALDQVSGGGWFLDWIKSWHKKLSEKNAQDIGEIVDMVCRK